MRVSLRRRVFAKSMLDTWFLLIMTTALLVIFRFLQPGWLNSQTLQSLVAQNAPLALVAVAMTFAIVSRHIDLSPGGMVALTGAVIGLVYGSHGLALGLLAGLAAALGVGLLNGFLVAAMGLNAIMVTLAAFIWARGLTIGANQGNPIDVGGGLADVVNASWGGFTLTAPVVLAAYIFGWLLLSRTKMGRYTYAMGGDMTAARRAGIKTSFYTILIFLLMGAMVGISAIITVGQLGSAQATAGVGLELDAIIAVVIGGTRLTGGEGSVGRTALGVAFLSILNSGLLNLGLTDAYFQLYRGLVLLAVLSVQILVRRMTDEEERRRQERGPLSAAVASP
ncbi:MAG: ABC transporter permease [Actinomycetota bacterium]|nr:ABC transporter permease [Actinomycetota bacterium]